MEITTEGLGFSPERLARIAPFLQSRYIDSGKVPGCQLLVARRGRPALRASLGQMDRERGLVMRDDTIFRIYSMTKPITSVALMMLYEQGRFQLDDPVHDLVPAFRDLRVYRSGEGASVQTTPCERPLTFRHLLSHTGGLSLGPLPVASALTHPVDEIYRSLQIGPAFGDTLETFVQKLARAPLRFVPGERWQYSVSTDVCGHLVELLSGQRFDRYLEEHIFQPLRMRDTSFSIAADKLDRFAACYALSADRRVSLMDDPRDSRYARPPAFLSGGGGLLSTLSDYARFCAMLLSGGELDGARVLGRRTIALMTRSHLPNGHDLAHLAQGTFSETAYEGVGFGLGFATTLESAVPDGYSAGDYFWGGLASTIFWVDPKEELAVIFLTQLVPSMTYKFRAELKNLVYSALAD